MPYATRSDFESFGLPSEALDALDARAPGAVDRALAGASAIADGYLATRYVLPLATWSDDLRLSVCAIAAANLMVTLGLNPESTDAMLLRGRSKDAQEWLRGVAAKKIHPAVTEGGTAVDGATVVSQAERGWDATIDESRGW